jgi:hypothetical protein
MLDLTILRQSDGSLEFDVYRKPTHTNQYIAWDSDQPLQHKDSTILSLTRRARLFPTGDTRQTAELKRVHQVLALKGYPSWAIRRYSYRHLPPAPPPPPADTTIPQPPHQTPPIPVTNTAPPRHKATVSLPYHRGTSEIISMALRKTDVGIISSNKNSLRTQLVHLKDPIPHTHKSTVVYHAPGFKETCTTVRHCRTKKVLGRIKKISSQPVGWVTIFHMSFGPLEGLKKVATSHIIFLGFLLTSSAGLPATVG